MRSDVPENELTGVKTAQGPFTIGAVGGVQVMARDAWMVKVKMTDGPQEVIECLTVDRVTSDFPRIDLTEATTAIKSSAPQNAHHRMMSYLGWWSSSYSAWHKVQCLISGSNPHDAQSQCLLSEKF